MRLWPGGAPGSEGWTQQEAVFGNTGARGVRNVVDPTITVFLPDPGTATGAGVIIAPGGGFRFRQWDNEGTRVAEYLQKHGVAGFVLTYRLTDTGTSEAFGQMNAQARGGIPPDSPQPPTGAPYGGGPIAIGRMRPLSLADGHQAMLVVRERAAEWHLDRTTRSRPNRPSRLDRQPGGGDDDAGRAIGVANLPMSRVDEVIGRCRGHVLLSSTKCEAL